MQKIIVQVFAQFPLKSALTSAIVDQHVAHVNHPAASTSVERVSRKHSAPKPSPEALPGIVNFHGNNIQISYQEKCVRMNTILRIAENCTALDVTAAALEKMFYDGYTELLKAGVLPVGDGDEAFGPAAPGASSRTTEAVAPKQIRQERPRSVNFSLLLPSPYQQGYALFLSLGDGSAPDPAHVTSSQNKGFDFGEQLRANPSVSFPYIFFLSHTPQQGRTREGSIANDLTLDESAVATPTGTASGTRRESVADFAEFVDASAADVASRRISVDTGSATGLLRRSTIELKTDEKKDFLDFVRKGQKLAKENRRKGKGTPVVAVEDNEQYPPTPAQRRSPADAPLTPLTDPRKGSTTPRKKSSVSASGYVDSSGVALDSLQCSQEDIMTQAGLTLYDVARHGSGPVADNAKSFVLSTCPKLYHEDLLRRREENVAKIESRRKEQELNSLDTGVAKVMSLRETLMYEQKKQKEALQKTSLEKARELDRVLQEKLRREAEEEAEIKRLAIIQKKEAAAQKERLAALSQKIDKKLTKSEEARLSHRKQIHEETDASIDKMSEEKLPVFNSLIRESQRPQLKRIEASERQQQMYSKLVAKLEDDCAQNAELQTSYVTRVLQQRQNQEDTAAEENIVKEVEDQLRVHKLMERSNRMEEKQRHEQVMRETGKGEGLNSRPLSTFPESFVKWGTADAHPESPEEREDRFRKWREDREHHATAEVGRKELHIRRRVTN